VKPQWVHCKLGEIIEQPCSDVLAHTPEVCIGAHLYNEYPAIRDGQDSWGVCTTSIECKNVLTTILTVMSAMDPHMMNLRLGVVLVCRLVLVGFVG
jgi:hypothetical protein